MSFQLAHPAGTAVGRVQERDLAAAQAFNVGALVLVDANGAIAECGADPAAIAGVAMSGCGADASGFNILAKKEFPPGKMQMVTVKGRHFTCKYLGTLPAADGATYGVTRDTDLDWKVDFAKSASNQRVKLVGRRTASPENIARVIVEFLDANVQSIQEPLMPFIRGGNAELLAPGLNRFTFNRLRERPSQFTRYVDVRTSTRAWEDSFEMGGFGPLAKKGELTPTMLDEALKLGGVRFIHDSFALGFLVSEEMREDEQYGVVNSLAGALGRSARITAELYGHDVLNNGFAATKYVGRDGKALFALDHPLVGTGGTYANRPSVAVDISEAAIEAAIASFDSMVDDRGITTEVIPSILLVTPNDRMLAKRLLNSAGMPGGNNNDVNPLYDEGLTLMVSNWLTDPDAWFLLGRASESPIIFYWRKQPDTKTWDDDNADGTFHKIKQRHSTGFNDWRNSYGSPGA